MHAFYPSGSNSMTMDETGTNTNTKQREKNLNLNLYNVRRVLSMVIDAGFCIGLGSILSFRGRLMNQMFTISGLWAIKDVVLQRFDKGLIICNHQGNMQWVYGLLV